MTIATVERNDQFLTHHTQPEALNSHLQELSKKITTRGDLPHTSVEEQLDILRQLATFKLGQFLIQNRGLNGYWIDYIINEPKRMNGIEALSSLEKFILFEAPVMRATRERYSIFQHTIQENMETGVAMASCPCGIMSDFLTIDNPFPEGLRLYGIDIDQDSLSQAQEEVDKLGYSPMCTFVQGDAWHFTLPEKVNFITSNGLNIYVDDDERVVELYQQFFSVLKPGGTLLTSVITPPSVWKVDHVDVEALRLQRIIINDIIGATWNNYRSVEKTREQLENAGFTNITFIPDACGVYPSVVAQRPK